MKEAILPLILAVWLVMWVLGLLFILGKTWDLSSRSESRRKNMG